MSLSELFPIVGFVAGLVGSVHCVAMCGGLVGVISESMNASFRGAIKFWGSYHFGRITSYSVAGVVVGGATGQVGQLFPIERSEMIGSLIAGLLMVILGGHVARWWNLLSIIEQAGGRIWQKVVPLFSRFLSPKLYRHAIVGGLLWGWIPCGLVYSTLVVAAATADPVAGGLTMAAFGIGTLPMLFGMGAMAGQLQKLKGLTWFRTLMGVTLCIFGVVIFLSMVSPHIGHQAM